VPELREESKTQCTIGKVLYTLLSAGGPQKRLKEKYQRNLETDSPEEIGTILFTGEWIMY